MPRSKRTTFGFSLIELMLVVAIIGVLTVVALPNFRRYQYRAKSSEAITNIAAIALTQKAYFAEKGFFATATSPAPATLPGNARALWNHHPDFAELGWIAEGPVYFQYLFSADGAGQGRFTIEAVGDLDGNGSTSYFGYVYPSGGSGIDGRLPGSTCAGTGVWNGGAKAAIRMAGPCDELSGREIF